MKQIFSKNDFTASYISRPGDGGYAGILTFSQNSADTPIDRGFLCQSASITFSRSVGKHYFLNVKGIGYILGRGTGSMTITGLLGEATEFAELFGEDETNPCNGLFTAKLDAFGMEPCDRDQPEGILIMSGVIPQGFTVTAQCQDQTGALWYTANATFEIAGLGVDAGTRRNEGYSIVGE